MSKTTDPALEEQAPKKRVSSVIYALGEAGKAMLWSGTIAFVAYLAAFKLFPQHQQKLAKPYEGWLWIKNGFFEKVLPNIPWIKNAGFVRDWEHKTRPQNIDGSVQLNIASAVSLVVGKVVAIPWFKRGVDKANAINAEMDKQESTNAQYRARLSAQDDELRDLRQQEAARKAVPMTEKLSQAESTHRTVQA